MHISAIWRAVDQDKPLAISEIPVEPEEYVDYWLPPFPEVPSSVEEPDHEAVPVQAKVEEESNPNQPNFPPNPPNPPLALAAPPTASQITWSGWISRAPAYLADYVNYTALMTNIAL